LGFVGNDFEGAGSSNISPSDCSEADPLLACLLAKPIIAVGLLSFFSWLAAFVTFVGLPTKGACDFAGRSGCFDICCGLAMLESLGICCCFTLASAAGLGTEN
jgi:hypothetical protein